MDCSKCGHVNPDTTRTCILCGQDWEGATPAKEKVPVGRIILFSVVLAVLLILSIMSVIASYIAVVFLTIYLTKNIVNVIKKGRGKLKYFVIPIFVFSDIFLICTLVWRLDAPPIPDDYTVSDLRTGGVTAKESFRTLSSLADKHEKTPEGIGIGLSQDEIGVIRNIYSAINNEPNSREAFIIRELWEKAATGRATIHKLNGYEEIADLTESDMHAIIGFLGNLKDMAILYNLHVKFECQEGDTTIPVREIIEFDSVVRKLSINARSLITKLVCYGCLGINIETANYIINNPKASQEDIELLAGHFEPVADEVLSLRNSFISEYITNTQGVREMLFEKLPFMRYIRNGPIKWNSTFRVCRNYWDELIESVEGPDGSSTSPLSAWPEIYPDLGPVVMNEDGEFTCYYESYNPVGVKILQMMLPALGKIIEQKTISKVRDDIFQIMLHARLGREVGLKALAYSDEYVIDKDQNIIFSCGPDGQAYSEDDIKLSFDPVVVEF